MSGAFAELFVSLGIKGSEKTLNVLSSVKTGMGGIRDTSLAAKAAILAAVYALEKMTMGAANTGYDIKTLSTYLDIGTKSLQQWQYAALAAGISNDEFNQSAKAIHQHIKDYAGGGALPKGSMSLAQETKFKFTNNFKVDDILPKLLEFAKNKKYSRENVENILEGWGLTPTEISKAIEGKFSAANVSSQPFIKESELNSLSNVKVDWDKLEAKVKRFMMHLTAKDGADAVKNLNQMADSFFRIANDIERISTKLGFFKLINDAFSGWDKILGAVADGIEGKRDRKNDFENWVLPTDEENKKFVEDMRSAYKLNKIMPNNDPLDNILGSASQSIFSGFKSTTGDLFSGFKEAIFDLNRLVVPSLPSRYSLEEPKKVINNNINQTISFQPGTDIDKAKHDISRHIVAAIRSADNGRIT